MHYPNLHVSDPFLIPWTGSDDSRATLQDYNSRLNVSPMNLNTDNGTHQREVWHRAFEDLSSFCTDGNFSPFISYI